MTTHDASVERRAVQALLDAKDTVDPDSFVRGLVESVERLIQSDPDPSLAHRASLMALKTAIRSPDRSLEVAAARTVHLASRAARDRPGATSALKRMREAAEASGSVEGLYDATWLELLAAVTSGDRFGVRRSIGALRSFATAGHSHRAVALHRAAREIADSIAGPVPRGSWPDGTPLAEDRELGPALAAWISIDDERLEDARFALDRILETDGIDRLPASIRDAAVLVAARSCALLGATEHAPVLLDALGRVPDVFVVTGPQPLRWLGSVDLAMAEVAQVAGDVELASSRLEAARDACDALGAHSMQDRLDRLDRRSPGRGGSAAPSAPPPAVDNAVRLERTGTMWRYRRADIDVVLPDRKGLDQLRRLLSQPGREHHCVDLVGRAIAVQAGVETIDDQAKKAYRARYDDLLATIGEAEAWNDDEREFRAREELTALADELASGVGLSGRTRRTGSTVERARVNATRTIRAASALLARHDPLFGAHLERCVRTGAYCVYESDGAFDVSC